MAIVRITDTLSREVIANVDKLFAAQLDAARKWECPVTATYIYETIFEPWQEHLDALPRDMIVQGNEFTINKVHDVTLGAQKFTLPTQRPMPRLPSACTHASNANTYYGAAYNLNDDGSGKWDELYTYVKARNDRIDVVLKRIAEVKDGVNKVLVQFTTLAPALKAWPPLWDLLPEHAKTKHKEVVERKKSSTIENVDTSALTGAITFAKLIR